MKIITKDCAYVQYTDIAELIDALIVTKAECPQSVLETCYGTTFTCNSDNQFEFMEFYNEDAIEFFKNLNYMVDYNDIKEASEEALANYSNSLAFDRNKMIQTYNQMSKQKQDEYQEDVELRTRLLDHKIQTLEQFRLFKAGKLRMDLPEGISTYDEGNLSKVVVPEVPQGKAVYLSGRGPNYLTVAIAEAYAHTNSSVSLFQPGIGYTCSITHSRAKRLGDLTKDPLGKEEIKEQLVASKEASTKEGPSID